MTADNKDDALVASDEEVVSIQEDIGRTRDQMKTTLEALEQKLNPSNVRDRAATELEGVGGYVKPAFRAPRGGSRLRKIDASPEISCPA